MQDDNLTLSVIMTSLQDKWGAQPPFASQLHEKRVGKLRQGGTPLYSTQGRNAANENSAVMIAFQVSIISKHFWWQTSRFQPCAPLHNPALQSHAQDLAH